MTDRDRLPVAYDDLSVTKKNLVKPVTTPSFQKLWERYVNGAQGKKEILRRIGKVDAKKLPEAEAKAFAVLTTVARNNGWIE